MQITKAWCAGSEKDSMIHVIEFHMKILLGLRSDVVVSFDTSARNI